MSQVPALQLKPETRATMRPMLDHIETQSTLACYAATMLVAAASVVVGGGFAIVHQLGLLGREDELDCALGVSFLVVVGALLAALYSALPNVKPIAADDRLRCVYFFGAIGKGDYQDFRADLLQQEKQEMLDEELLHQIYGKSNWLRGKFVSLRISVVAAISGTVLLTFSVLFGVFFTNPAS